MTVKEIFDQMEQAFNADLAKGMNAVIQFNLSGDQGGTYHTVIKDGGCKVAEGAHAARTAAPVSSPAGFIKFRREI